MSMGLRWMIATCCLLTWAAAGAGAYKVKGLRVGQPAPNFHVTTFDGTELSLADFKGQVLVLNFWATWCGPCRRELPLLSAYYTARADAGLRVLAVATEDSLSPAQLKPVSKIVSFTMVKRFRGDYPKVYLLPTNFVIDRAGIVRYAEAGGFTLDSMNELLIPLLRESAPATARNIE